eukprot:1549347-Heterocapsa_arctica.AAC.1
MLQMCYKSVKQVLRKCSKCVKCVTTVIQLCYTSAPQVLQHWTLELRTWAKQSAFREEINGDNEDVRV